MNIGLMEGEGRGKLFSHESRKRSRWVRFERLAFILTVLVLLFLLVAIHFNAIVIVASFAFLLRHAIGVMPLPVVLTSIPIDYRSIFGRSLAKFVCNYAPRYFPITAYVDNFEDFDLNQAYEEEMPKCSCGRVALLRTSWTNENAGRRFFSCPLPQDKRCNFFQWADPEMCERAIKVILGLLRKNQSMEGVAVGKTKVVKTENRELKKMNEWRRRALVILAILSCFFFVNKQI